MPHALPPIVMTWHEHARLSNLARIVWSSFPDSSEYLERELDRAKLVAPDQIAPNTITMGSRVEFAYAHSGIRQVVTLVYPRYEDIAAGKISVLSPVGAALIGLTEGQSIDFRTLRGEQRTITILKVNRSVDDNATE